MQITNTYNQLSNKPNLIQTIKAANNQNAQSLNCVRIAKVLEFFPQDLTVKVQLVNKRLLGLNPDGSQILEEYPPIFAKVCYCNPFETFPLTQGMECVLLFSDREIESWFINGETNQQKYPRMHDLTDAIAIVGIRSLPNMIQILLDCLHLFYGQSDIQIKDTEINLNTATFNIQGNTMQNGNTKQTGNFDITGDTIQSGTITATTLKATSAASGVIKDSSDKVLATVTNGIITEIKE